MAANVEKRYTALRIISWVFRVVAVVFLIGIIIWVICSFVWTEKTSEKASSMLEEEALKISARITWIEVFFFRASEDIGRLIGMIIGAIALYAFGELISLLIALEENTRRTSLILQQKG